MISLRSRSKTRQAQKDQKIEDVKGGKGKGKNVLQANNMMLQRKLQRIFNLTAISNCLR
jgi:hypothetical protein